MSAKGGSAGERTVTLDVHLLGRDYKVACKEHERAELMDAVAFLDAHMREIRGTGKTAGDRPHRGHGGAQHRQRALARAQGGRSRGTWRRRQR